MHLEEQAAQIADLFARLGGGAGAPSAPPLATGLAYTKQSSLLKQLSEICQQKEQNDCAKFIDCDVAVAWAPAENFPEGGKTTDTLKS